MFASLGLLLCLSLTEPTNLSLVSPTNANAPYQDVISADAVQGAPMHVGSILIPYGQLDPGVQLRVHVSEDSGRVFYPAVTTVALPTPRRDPREPMARPRLGNGVLLDRLRHAIQSGKDAVQPPKALRISFVFTGTEPLHLQLLGDVNLQYTLDVAPPSPQHEQLLNLWWTDYVAQSKQALERGDYPPLIQTYLTSMLASKFDRPVPDLRSDEEKKTNWDEPLGSLRILAGLESLRTEILKESLARPDPLDQRKVPLPNGPQWHDVIPPETPEQTPIEPIATRVPPECFYLRFGKFSNYIWFRDLSDRYGGELSQLVLQRGFSLPTSKRMERMLNTKSTLLAKLFGDAIIADMALIGRDFYLHDGPSLGVLFEAKNPEILLSALQQERTATAKKLASEGVRLESISLHGTDVSLLHAPDHSIRSFLVSSGPYVLLTTSQSIAERFLQVSEGQPSLADSAHFRFARLLMPERHQYSLFGYLSPEFFRGLLSPDYQIELRRRLKAMAYMETAEMARYAARAEGFPLDDIPSLMQHGFLPPHFETRADGSRTLRDGDRWVDSLRGGRGSFLPIADVELNEVSQAEADRYLQQANFFQSDWKQTDPLMFGLRRFASPNGQDQDQLALEAYIAPFGSEKYGWLSSFLGPPIEQQIQLPEDDVANLQVHMAGSDHRRHSTPNHVLFLGLKDLTPPKVAESKGLIQTLRMLKETPAYLGAWPLPGYLDRLPLGLGGGRPDVLGFSKMLIGLWRWQGDGFSVLSFDRSILEQTIPKLAIVPASDPAQLRFHCHDLTQSQLASWVNTKWYREGLRISLGNANLFDTVNQQLHLPPPDAQQTAERLLDCTFRCPLGGEYQSPTQSPLWISSAWLGDTNLKTAMPPPDYTAPWLQLFRGGEAHLTQLPDRLILVAKIDLQKLPPSVEVSGENTASLPSLDFDLFKLPFSLVGGNDPKADKKSDKPSPDKKDQRRAF